MKTATHTQGVRGDTTAEATRRAVPLRASACAVGHAFIPFSGQKAGGVR